MEYLDEDVKHLVPPGMNIYNITEKTYVGELIKRFYVGNGTFSGNKRETIRVI